jgi:hypothetical protein
MFAGERATACASSEPQKSPGRPGTKMHSVPNRYTATKTAIFRVYLLAVEVGRSFTRVALGRSLREYPVSWPWLRRREAGTGAPGRTRNAGLRLPAGTNSNARSNRVVRKTAACPRGKTGRMSPKTVGMRQSVPFLSPFPPGSTKGKVFTKKQFSGRTGFNWDWDRVQFGLGSIGIEFGLVWDRV